jgi:hypothetical protein
VRGIVMVEQVASPVMVITCCLVQVGDSRRPKLRQHATTTCHDASTTTHPSRRHDAA